MDASSSQALPLVRWVSTLCQCLPGLSSYHDVDLCLFIGVGLHLLQMWWPSSCRDNSLLERQSWTTGTVPSPCGRMDWQLLSAPSERCTQNMMSATSGLGLSSRRSLPNHATLVPGPNGLPTSIGRWRSARSSFSYRRQTWRCKR
jgi:hypothetical protein